MFVVTDITSRKSHMYNYVTVITIRWFHELRRVTLLKNHTQKKLFPADLSKKPKKKPKNSREKVKVVRHRSYDLVSFHLLKRQVEKKVKEKKKRLI